MKFRRKPNKEIKKSKQFEIRKIVRRVKQATEDGQGQGAAATAKLQAQLAAARAADVDLLTKTIAASYGIQQQQDPHPQQEKEQREGQGAAPGSGPAADRGPPVAGEAAQAVHGRILAAKCVRDQALAAQRDLQQLAKKLAGAAAKEGAAADLAGEGAGNGAQQMEQQQQQEQHEGLNGGTHAQAANGGALEQQQDGRKQPGSACREVQKGTKELPLNTMAEGALAKLLAGHAGQRTKPSSSAQHATEQRSSRGSDDDSHDDSGLVGSDPGGLAGGEGDSGSELGAGYDSGSEPGSNGFDSEAYDSAGEGAKAGSAARGRASQGGGNEGPGSERGREQLRAGQKQEQREAKQKKKAAALAKKSKNRLGQRARRLLAARMYGGSARHFLQQQEQQGAAGGGAVQGTDRPSKKRPLWSAPAVQQPAQQAERVQQRGEAKAAGHGEQADAALHPSWAAKRQQKLQISISAAPAAKKIMFDEDGPAGAAAAPTSAKPNMQPSGASAVRAAPARDKQQRQPAGKQQQQQHREQQAPQQGRHKGSTSRGSVEAAGPLHPSWEARKQQAAQQKKLPQPTGKKITFDDD
ncbi:hypothetical protein N2152v2_009760 [Parachlorella kessleri]